MYQVEGRFRYKSSKQCQHLKAKAGGQTCFLMSFYKFLSLQMTVPLQSKTPQISGKKRGLDEVTLPIIGYWIILDPAGYHSCLGWNKEQLLSTGWKMNSLLGVNSIKTCAEASNYFLTSLKSSIFTHNLCFVDIINFTWSPWTPHYIIRSLLLENCNATARNKSYPVCN